MAEERASRGSPVATRVRVAVFLSVALALAAFAAALALGASRLVASGIAGAVGLAAAGIAAHAAWAPTRDVLRAVEDGLRSCREQDYSLRLRSDRTDELGTLIGHYNEMADALRRGHSDVHARELVLDTLLQRTPIAFVLAGKAGRILYANATARRLFAGAFAPGRLLADVLERVPDDIRAMIERKAGGIATIATDRGEEVVRVLLRDIELGTVPTQLIILEPITQELRRQEVETWKKVLRVVSHELNNSLAPVSSLLHSARHVASVDGDGRRQDAILEKLEERVERLARFLDGYTRYARLPRPRPEPVDLRGFVDGLTTLYPFRIAGELPTSPAVFDAGQMQQLVINLLKNAHEAGGDPADVTLAIERTTGGELTISVSDRGEGMPDAILHGAILPFSSAKPNGMGVGLALCNEIVVAHGGRLSIRSRVGAGTTVTCILPAA